jgi:hypothetical protein
VIEPGGEREEVKVKMDESGERLSIYIIDL